MQNFARLSTGLSQDLIQDLMNPTLQRDFGLFFPPLMAINRAHVVMLAEREILSGNDVATTLRGLDTVEADLTPTALREDLDLYYNVERRLQAVIGPVAGRMHTARSRNDLQATYQRLAVRETLDGVIGDVIVLRERLVDLAERHVESVMPGYTHTQPAQPVTFGHYLLSVHDAFARDEERLVAARPRMNRSPLGAGALATTGFPIDRARTAALLGFDGLVEASIDAVASRDYILEGGTGARRGAVEPDGAPRADGRGGRARLRDRDRAGGHPGPPLRSAVPHGPRHRRGDGRPLGRRGPGSGRLDAGSDRRDRRISRGRRFGAL
jgi:argininosuccinate lyase